MADINPTERYLITMRSVFALPNGELATHEATDHVATDHLDAYVADARTRWQAVIVADQPDTHDADAPYNPPALG